MHACSVMSKSLRRPHGFVAHQARLSMGIFRQEHWSGLPFPPLGDLPYLVIEPTSPVSPALQAVLYLLSHQGSPQNSDWKYTKCETVPFPPSKNLPVANSLFHGNHHDKKNGSHLQAFPAPPRLSCLIPPHKVF